MFPRLDLALESGLTLSQPLSVIGATPAHDLTGLARETEVVQPFKPFHDHFLAMGYAAVPEADAPCEDVVLFLPRSKALARSQIQKACARANGVIVVDGAKTDGIDSILKDIRKRLTIERPISKAHGKIFWFKSDAGTFADWAAPQTQKVDGFQTAPGVFSADGIDPASAMLRKSLPKSLGHNVADLGAGWGFLAAGLMTDPGIKQLHLVEADQTALNCARVNVTDPRARFQWSDAVSWTAPDPLDAIVMNPPFHTSRSADPALGQGFITSAARNLSRAGHLWMVANRHLPYEATLTEAFTKVDEIAGDNRFKVFHASRPRR